MEYTITHVTQRQEPGLLDSTISGLHAAVTLANGSQMELSRMDGDTRWVIDTFISRNGRPVWVNGFGARYLRVRALNPEDPTAMPIIADLDARAAALPDDDHANKQVEA